MKEQSAGEAEDGPNYESPSHHPNERHGQEEDIFDLSFRESIQPRPA